MPKKNGREALKEIKSHQKLKSIPVIILTTSEAEEEIVRLIVKEYCPTAQISKSKLKIS